MKKTKETVLDDLETVDMPTTGVVDTYILRRATEKIRQQADSRNEM